MQTLIVVDDFESLIKQHKQKFYEIFGSVEKKISELKAEPFERIGEYCVGGYQIKKGSDLTTAVSDLIEKIKEKRQESEKIIVLSDYDFKTGAGVEYTGVDLLRELREKVKEFKNSAFQFILSSALPYISGEFLRVDRITKTKQENGIDFPIFDEDQPDDLLLDKEEYKKELEKKCDDNIRKKLGEEIEKQTCCGNYFATIFWYLIY